MKRFAIFVTALSFGAGVAVAGNSDDVAARADRIRKLQDPQRMGALSLDSCPLKATVDCGSKIGSTLTTSSCIDPVVNTRGERFTIQGTVGQIIGVEMSSTSFSTFLIIKGPSYFSDYGNIISFLSSGRSTERVDFYVPITGTYTIQAESLYGPGDSQPSTGSYTLNVSCSATPPPACVDNNTLCLNSGRFHVTLLARDQRTGNTGTGLAIPSNDLFGYFAIPALTYNPSNPEVFVKVLDGRSLNGRFWVFYNGLTDLQFTLMIVDTFTGVTRTYNKDPGSACGGFDTSAF